MGLFEKDNAELGRFGSIPDNRRLDRHAVRPARARGELRTEILSIALETMANVHQTVADGHRKVAKTLRGTQE